MERDAAHNYIEELIDTGMLSTSAENTTNKHDKIFNARYKLAGDQYVLHYDDEDDLEVYTYATRFIDISDAALKRHVLQAMANHDDVDDLIRSLFDSEDGERRVREFIIDMTKEEFVELIDNNNKILAKVVAMYKEVELISSIEKL